MIAFYVHLSSFFIPTCRFYANPLREVEGDEFVLHFYDLSAKQPHTMYHFQWRRQLPPSQEGTSSMPDAESTPMVE
jgi:hypothetical protein